MQMDANPLLDFSGLPRFSAMKSEHIAPAIDALLAENRAIVDRLTGPETPATWADFAQPLEEAAERLGRAWGVVGHLHAVLDSPELRDAYKANQPKMVQYWTEIGQNVRAVREVQGAPRLARVRPPRAGPGQDGRQRDPRLPAFGRGTRARPEEALRRDSGRIGEARRPSSRKTPSTRPTPMRCSSRTAPPSPASRKTCSNRRVPPPKRRDVAAGSSYSMRPASCPSCSTRRTGACARSCTAARVTRASEEFGPPSPPRRSSSAARRERPRSHSRRPRRSTAWNNTPLIARMLELRRETARAPRLSSYAELSLVPKMAETPAQVLAFLDNSRPRRAPYARRDWAELTAFAAKELGLADLQACDVAFAAEKLRQARYAFSDQEVKQYFPEPKVLAGMFRLVETLYGIRIAEDRGRDLAPVRCGSSASPMPAGDAHRPVLSRPVRARHQAERRVDGRGDDAPTHPPGPAVAGRLPGVQLLCPRRGQARASHPRRRVDALPRVRPRPAPLADARSTTWAFPASAASNGTRWSCRASSWRISAGSGRCCGTCRRTSIPARRSRARSSTR